MTNLYERIRIAKTIAELTALEKQVCNDCTCKHMGYHQDCDNGHICKFEQLVASKMKQMSN